MTERDYEDGELTLDLADDGVELRLKGGGVTLRMLLEEKAIERVYAVLDGWIMQNDEAKRRGRLLKAKAAPPEGH